MADDHVLWQFQETPTADIPSSEQIDLEWGKVTREPPHDGAEFLVYALFWRYDGVEEWKLLDMVGTASDLKSWKLIL